MPKILLVDDTRLLLEMEKSFLDGSPVEVLTALNGEDALAIVKKERLDLIVLDQNMPKMNGVTFCAAIRRDPALSAIPVLMISSSCSREDLEAFTHAGCDDFLAKPLERASFLDKVRRFLPGIERRGVRIPCHVPVEMVIDGKNVGGDSKDLGLKGIYVACDVPVEAGEILALRFSLPGGSGTPAITANGRVAWINDRSNTAPPGYPPGFGVEFLEITGEGLALLRKNELSAFIATSGASPAKGKVR